MCFRLNAIILLRFVNAFLFLWLMLRLPIVYEQIKQWNAHFAQKQRPVNGTSSPSSSPSFCVPKFLFFPLRSVRLEAIRLNELFAKPSPFACQKRRKVPIIEAKDDAGTFFVCEDLYEKKKGKEKNLLISGFKNNQNAHKQQKKTTTVEQQQENLKQIGEEMLLNYTELPSKENKNATGNQKRPKTVQMELIKMEIYLTNMSKETETKMEHLFEQIEWQIERIEIRHLFLLLKPAAFTERMNDDKENSAILFLWYRFIHKLFFTWHFALLGVHSIGKCGKALQPFEMNHCEWRISFAKFDHFGQVEDIPCFGTGSPSEEKLRFLHLLLNGTLQNCSLSSIADTFTSTNFPIFCAPSDGSNFHKILFVRYRAFRAELDQKKILAELSKFAEVAKGAILYAPSAKYDDNKMSLRVKVTKCYKNCTEYKEENFNLTLSSEHFGTFLGAFLPNESPEGILLLLDLDGFEWEVLERIRNDKHCAGDWLKNVGQLSLRIRLWEMEESENWRHFYLLLLRLEECGDFERVFGRQIDQWTVQMIYRKKAKKTI